MTELWRELGGYTEMVDESVDMVVAEATVRYLGRSGSTTRRCSSSLGALRQHLDHERARDRAGPDGGRREGVLRHVFVETATAARHRSPDDIRAGLGRYG